MTQDEKLDLLITKFDKLESKVDNLEGRFDKLEGRFDNLERKVDRNYRELKKMDYAILDEVERVHGILMRHIEDASVHIS